MDIRNMHCRRIDRSLLFATVLAACAQTVHAQGVISFPKDRPVPTKQYVLDIGGALLPSQDQSPDYLRQFKNSATMLSVLESIERPASSWTWPLRGYRKEPKLNKGD
jgi:hypothetical protein